MRHKYATPALVLGKSHVGEATTSVLLLTPDFGVVRARSQGLRKPAAKMSAALQTFAHSDVSLLRGKDGWRTTGAILVENYAKRLSIAERSRLARVTELLQRLVRGEHREPELYILITMYIRALEEFTDEEFQDAAECLAALRLLHLLGFDAGELPGEYDDFSIPTITIASLERTNLIVRINNGIAASGL